MPDTRTSDLIQYGDVELEPATGTVRCQGRALALTPKEAALLAVLLAAPGRAFSRGELLRLVWLTDCSLRTRTVDMHVRKLRQKLGGACRIATVYKNGYRWERLEE